MRRLLVLVAAVGLGCDGSPPAAATTADAPASAGTTGRARNDDEAQPTTRTAMSDTRGAIPTKDVARYPLPGMAGLPQAVRLDPTGTRLTYLWSADGSLTRQLYAHDPITDTRTPMFEPEGGGVTEENLSPEEKLRRERTRERGLGVTRYTWAKDADRVLVPQGGAVWVQDGTSGTPRRIAEGGEHPCIDPQISRDGRFVAYVQDDEVYVVGADEGAGAPRQITQGARGTGRTHGLAEYIAQEEMDRHHGFWWNHAGDAIAYTRVDETHIPIWRITHEGDAQPRWEDHRYPFAGAANAKVELGVVGRGGGETTWMDLRMEGEAEVYLARVHWTPTGALLAELENRAQDRLQLVRFDRTTGAPKVLLEERSDVWINLHHAFEALEDGEGELAGAFVWGSERTGFRHLYLVDATGRVIRPLTEGEWMVDSLVGVDEKAGVVYFTGTLDGPTEQHLYRVPLSGGPPVRLTEGAGMHGIAMDRGFTTFVDTDSSLGAPPQLTVRDAKDGALRSTINVPADPRLDALELPPPELVTLAARDGLQLHGAVYKPAGAGPWPVVVSVYGGPHAQRVTQGWDMTVDMRAQYLRSLGYLVFKLDNRGSARRGLAFEGAIRHDLGNLEIRDQVDGVRWLVDQGLADPARVAIYGWSYGGYMAAMALARAPETFHVAIAGAMVSAWDGYDTHYTERYMGTPQSNPAGYGSSNVMTHIGQMTGHLMIVHGLIDENVHFRHSARLIDALNRARKPYELLLFPGERHMPRAEPDRVYMEERIRDFLGAHL